MSDDNNDARLSTGLPAHPKTKRLLRRLGPAGGWFLVRLILWARNSRADGDLDGMTDEDIELAVDWTGEPGAFVKAMAEAGFLDGGDGQHRLHDWADHQPWASGADMRSAKARWNAMKRHYGEAEADRRVPEWVAIRDAASNADSSQIDAASTANSNAGSNAAAMLEPRHSNAPSPSPSPSQELSSLRSDTSEPLVLTGKDPSADLKVRRAARVRQIAEDARDAFNQILAKPTGVLAACRVLNKPRLDAVEKALPTARQLCEHLYRDEKVTPAFWQAYFEEAAADDWYSGRQGGGPGHENWKPDFEYLVSEKAMVKVFERAMIDEEAA
ncbi:MAG TPA: hypothetical protein VIT62_06565 [Lysobacter sp.]